MSKITTKLTQGPADGSEFWTFLNDLVDDVTNLTTLVNDLKAKYDDLVGKYNAHVHVENADAVYTQSASVAAVIADSQGSTVGTAVTAKTTK